MGGVWAQDYPILPSLSHSPLLRDKHQKVSQRPARVGLKCAGITEPHSELGVREGGGSVILSATPPHTYAPYKHIHGSLLDLFLPLYTLPIASSLPPLSFLPLSFSFPPLPPLLSLLLFSLILLPPYTPFSCAPPYHISKFLPPPPPTLHAPPHHTSKFLPPPPPTLHDPPHHTHSSSLYLFRCLGGTKGHSLSLSLLPPFHPFPPPPPTSHSPSVYHHC